MRQNAALQKFDPKSSEAALSAVFSNFDKCRLELASDVIFGVVVDQAGTGVSVKLGDCDSRSNRC